ncbi:MAG: hypothetical protein JWQ40_4789 [Segetibacter sp.]|nr:hypothetical protein [Segetibacter sp.]
MKSAPKKIYVVAILLVSNFLFSFDAPRFSLPYKSSHLTERQAAAHLLSRFTYGAKPGDVEAVIKTGLEKWFLQQLNAGIPDDELNQRLTVYDAIHFSNTEVVNTFRNGGEILKMAIKDGFINKDSVDKGNKAAYRSRLNAYMQEKGFKPEGELYNQFVNQKIVRAAYTNNQLQELMTDFWFNHFNVSITKNNCAAFVPAYERDVIRPNAFGKFEDLLLATAKSPAMLMFLDNFISTGTNTGLDFDGNSTFQKKIAKEIKKGRGDPASEKAIAKLKQLKKSQGLNENYAREVMELHTLGVDGGYTQNDVTQAARVLTGWTVYPFSDFRGGHAIKKVLERVGEDQLANRGFVRDGDFLFAANGHDNGEKTVLGKKFGSNGGYEEGVQLLRMLAHHPSTARFISRKIAVRFVSDNPPESLINKMAKTFTDKDGSIKQVIMTMVSSPEFWSKAAVREKTKSPFELAVSTSRSLNADIVMPFQLYKWVEKMGQKLYYFQAPTGFPDKGQYWINTGSLLNRMNFGLAFASHRIPGIKIDLLALNQGHEPESAEAALAAFSKLMMPERDLSQTIKRLTPLLLNPELEKKVDNAAQAQSPTQVEVMQMQDLNMEDLPAVKKRLGKKGGGRENPGPVETLKGNNNIMSQVVGIIIGSPEFQRK